MSSPEPALILKTTPSGESFLTVHALSANRGLFLCLKRVSSGKSKNNSVKPDLFDTADLQLEPAKSGNSTLFVKDYRLHHSRANIGRSYTSLLHASNCAAILVRNATQLPDPGALFDLAERTCDAFESGKTPQIVFLKGLYLLLQTEGFPLREDWLQSLPAKARGHACTLIQNPVEEAPSAQCLETCESITEDLCRWLQRETDVILPWKT